MLHRYLDELMEMTPNNFISWHSREYLQVICVKDILSPCHGNSSVIPDVRGPGVSFLLLLIPNPWPLISGSKLFHWWGWRHRPRRYRGWGGRECCKDGSTPVRYTDGLSPNGKQGLVLLTPHPSVHIFVKFHRHFCKNWTLVNIYPSKHQDGNTDEPNIYSFFLQSLWSAARREMGLDLNNKMQESMDPQDCPNSIPSWCILSLFQHDPGTYFWD